MDSCCDYKVLLKPHVYTDVEYVKEMLSKYSNKFEITYLHPTLLAIRSNIFICINYSSTMADGHSFGVTTIEYSKYIPEELIATENRSAGYPFVDYFIQNDIALLRKVVSSVCGEVKKDIDYFKCENEDPSRLIYDLSH